MSNISKSTARRNDSHSLVDIHANFAETKSRVANHWESRHDRNEGGTLRSQRQLHSMSGRNTSQCVGSVKCRSASQSDQHFPSRQNVISFKFDC